MNKKISLALAIIAIVAISSIGFAGASVIDKSSIQTNLSNALTQRSYIRINGIITQWGTTDVNGALQTQAGTTTRADLSTNQGAVATAIWTTNNSRPITAVQAKQNFTYVFYEARLRNASVSTLSTSTSDPNYFLNGTWNVWTVTSTVNINTNADGQITSVHRSSDSSVQTAYGELNVTSNWTKFTLSINGIDPLTGSVVRSVQRQVQFNPFKVTDDTTSNVVTKSDIAAVIHAYGAMPGWGNYDVKMDFCNHFKIDIADLSTVAANM
jgi:uncharacterized cupin superfamily protein